MFICKLILLYTPGWRKPHKPAKEFEIFQCKIFFCFWFMCVARGFPGNSVKKKKKKKAIWPCMKMQKMQVRSLGWEDPLEKGTATHSSMLAWEIPWTAEPGGLQSMGSQRVGHDWATEHTRTQWVLPLAQDFAFKGISNQVLYLITRH